MGKLYEEGFGLALSRAKRNKVWSTLKEEVEVYLAGVEARKVPQQATREAVLESLASLDLNTPMEPSEVVSWTAQKLSEYQLHTTHPAYYGVFNPNPSTMSMPAEALTAVFNPQLASSASSMFCIEAEDYLIRLVADWFGFPEGQVEGIFTSGGTEANYSALLCALATHLEGWRENGLRGVQAWPRVYCTEESHHSTLRALRVAGLGTNALRVIPVHKNLKMNVQVLQSTIQEDRKAGETPLMIVGTLGTTSAGVVDSLEGLAEVAHAEKLWFHVDAAWGGAAALLPEFEELLAGLSRADSVTLDPHKWLSVSMGCGMFVTQKPGVLRETFGLEQSVYMPEETFTQSTTEPYRESLQWSRRFLGLRLLMTLMTHGLDGYREVLRHQVKMGEYLKEKLVANGWTLVNETPLPVACFTQEDVPLPEVLAHVNGTGETWLTDTVLRFSNERCLRIGISNFATQEEHIDLIVQKLNEAREAVRGS